ncbi:MAG: DUF1737 domain-containing protein [bacterium]
MSLSTNRIFIIMILYRFVTGPDNDEFCRRVSDALNHGWILYGDPTLTFNGETPIAGQALTKEVEGEEFTGDTDLKSY